MAAAQVDLARKAAAAALDKAQPASKFGVDKKTMVTATTKIKSIGAQIGRISKPSTSTAKGVLVEPAKTTKTSKGRPSKKVASGERLMEKIQDLSRRLPLPKYRPELLLIMQQQQKEQQQQKQKQTADKHSSKKPTSDEDKLPKAPPPHLKQLEIKLEARTCVLADASYLRRYLIEEREREAIEAKYDLGEVVWAKVKGEPWWPAMISVHPQRDCYLKYRSKNTIAYHIQTFGVVFHGWVSEREIMSRFTGFEPFEAFMLDRITACKSSPELEKVWKSFAQGMREKKALFSLAVAEAEAAGRLTTAQRLSTVTYRYYSRRYSKFFEA